MTRRGRPPGNEPDPSVVTAQRELDDEPTGRRTLGAQRAVDHCAATERRRVDSGAATQLHALPATRATPVAGGAAAEATQLAELEAPSSEKRSRTPRVFGAISIVLALPSLALLTCLPTADVWSLTYGGLRIELRRSGQERGTRIKIEDALLHAVVQRGLRRPRARPPEARRNALRRPRRLVDLSAEQLSPQASTRLRRVYQLGQAIVISFLVFGLLLFFAGVGELRGRAWGRRLALLWGTLGLLYVLALLFFLAPEYARAARDLAEAVLGNYHAAERVCPPFGGAAMLAAGGLLALYPLATLVYFNSSLARQAMR